MGKIAALAAILVLAACTTSPAPIADPRTVWCETNSPRRPSLAEIAVMQPVEKKAAVEHNRKGALWCGWEN
jgi:hypothetical protein